MRKRGLYLRWRLVIILGLLSGSLTLATGVRAEPDFLDVAFRSVWERADLPTESGAVTRTFVWGPALFIAPDGPKLPRTEPYRDLADGLRTIQYFEKARMELTTPDKGRVTVGLLVREMVSGMLQLGDTQMEPYAPAGVPVAGDPTNNPCPTYATLAKVASITPGVNTAPDRTGMAISGALKTDGTVIPVTGIADPTTYSYYVPETKHNIAAPFWTFLTQEGPVIGGDGKLTTGKLFDPPFFAVGLPITEPYWTKAIVGGKARDVLVQAFERRLLTYTPANPDGFKVEMGNVGAAYTRWRYGPVAEPPPVTTVEPNNGPTGSLLLFSAPGFTPDETVVARLIFADGHTVEKPGGTAGSTGIARAFLETNAKEYPAGSYKVNLVGTKSNQIRPGGFSLAAPPANGLIVQALPGTGDTLTTYTFYASGLNPGDTINIWVSGPTGTAYNLNGSRTQTVSDHGTLQQTLIPKSLNTSTLIGPWAFVVQESGTNARHGSAAFVVNPPPKATL
ncbi:MAG: hypothetical protein ACYDAR_13740 [Thermomicrobiales bacterium]